MNLWQERFTPSELPPILPTIDEFNQAWNWIFEKHANGDFIRAELCLIIIRNHSLKLRRNGLKESAKAAVWGIFKIYGVVRALPERKTRQMTVKMPTRGV